MCMEKFANLSAFNSFFDFTCLESTAYCSLQVEGTLEMLIDSE